MSSKEQFREAMKRDKRIMAELRNQIQVKDKIIQDLRFQLRQQNNKTIQTYRQTKRWWQFWK